MTRSHMPETTGLADKAPMANVGKMKSYGFDWNAAYSDQIGQVKFTIRANMTYQNTEILDKDEAANELWYKMEKGFRMNQTRGLIAMGLFKDEEDVRSSPRQDFGGKEVLPGDIKYKDINGDGKIDDDDEVPLSYSNVPRIQYGFALDWNYKAFRVSILFEGVSKVQYFQGGIGYYPFANEARGNLLAMTVNQKNRWTPASYSGDPSTENPNAKFPRLTYGENKNNNRASTFWLADGRYLRLKNVDISYRFTNNWLKTRVGVEGATISLIGENLHVWDKVKLFDPTQASSNGAAYPLQRMYTLQLNLTF